ncbi:septum site-determining protein Ssd [Nocardioides sp. Bht2]|uniref:septum site-determining protein Ssd n=1 Tax=Nocardioides sp. Bht2 TaxID=3392297 RepID=UPI0039B6CAFC
MDKPLILTRDPQLLDHLHQLSAAAGATPNVHTDPRGALAAWATSHLVLVGVDLLGELQALAPNRRPGVYLVSMEHLPDRAFREAVGVGIDGVAELPRSDSWLMELLADVGEFRSKGVSIGVVAGSGGAGASTFACALAVQAATRTDAALLDIDPYGPGIDMISGFDQLDGLRWEGLGQTTGRLSARVLRESLPRKGRLGVLSWADPRRGLVPFAVREAMSASVRGHDITVLDLPRTPDPVVDEVAARCTHLVVVVRTDVAGISAAGRLLERILPAGPASVLVRGGAADLTAIERVLDVPVIAAMPDQRGLNEAIDLGLGPIHSRRSVLARAAKVTLRHFGLEPARGRAA